MGDQRALECGAHEAGLASESPRCDARPAHGPAGAPPQQGAVFVVGLGQQLATSAPYKGQLEGWLGTAAWWTAVSPYVAWWAQEAYPSCSRVCVAGSKVGARSTRLNEFTEHPARLAFAGTASAAPARALFDRAYLPLMTAYWRDAKGYGEQPHLARPDGDAREPRGLRGARLGDPQPVPGRAHRVRVERASAGRDGAAQVQALATGVAQSIQAAYGDGGTATRACGPTGSYAWCKAVLGGARFNPGWATFASW